ncbi:hypothetical protein Tco_0873293 [Tanacetum coccineum]
MKSSFGSKRGFLHKFMQVLGLMVQYSVSKLWIQRIEGLGWIRQSKKGVSVLKRKRGDDEDQDPPAGTEKEKKTWFNDMVNAEKDPLTFDDLMATPIDFTKFAMNRLKKDKITKADLVGPVYKLLKGTCKSSIELEYNIEQCYLTMSDQLDWAS